MITQTRKKRVTRVALLSACVLHRAGCAGSVALVGDAVVISLASERPDHP
jgi:hypothetical protein